MKSLTPKGAYNSDVFPRCSVPPPDPVPAKSEAEQCPHFPRKSTGAFCKWSDMKPKSPNKIGRGALPQPRAHRRGWPSACSPQPKRTSFGNSPVASDGARTPGRRVGANTDQICDKIFAKTETVWMVLGQGTRPHFGHACRLVATEQKDLPILSSCCQLSAWLVTELRKAKAPNFLYEKDLKGSSERGLRHLMTVWRSWFKMPLHEEARSLGKLPFVSGPSFLINPLGKTARSLLSGGLLELYIKDHRVSGHCGDGNQMNTQPEMKTQRKAFSNRSNLSQFCHLQLQRYKLYYFVYSGNRKTFYLSNTDSCQQ